MPYQRTTAAAFAAAWSLSLLGQPATTLADDSVMLKAKFNEGSRVYLESVTNVEQQMTGTPMGDMNVKAKVLYGLWQVVQPAEEGQHKIELTFDRALRELSMPMFGDSSYDTDDPANVDGDPQMRAVLNPMIGETLTMVVDKDGKLASFSGMNDISEKISAGAVMNMHWQQMQHEFTDEVAREVWGNELLSFLPNREATVGEKWTGSSAVDNPMLGTFVTEYAYTLKELREQDGRKIAVIDVDGIIKLKETDNEDPAAPKLDGTIDGEIRFDVESGTLVGRSLTQKSTVNFVPPGGTPESRMTGNTVVKHDLNIVAPEKRLEEKKAADKKTLERKKAAAEEAMQDDADEEDGDDDED